MIRDPSDGSTREKPVVALDIGSDRIN